MTSIDISSQTPSTEIPTRADEYFHLSGTNSKADAWRMLQP